MPLDGINGIALSGLTAINGIAKSGLSEIDGQTIGGGGTLIYAVNVGAGDLDGYLDDAAFWDSVGLNYTDSGAIDTSLLTDVPSQGVLQSYRYRYATGAITWTAGSLSNVPHTVRVFLWSDGGVGTQDITINGVLAGDNVDVASLAGGTYKAIQIDYAVTPSANDITLEIFANSGYFQLAAFKIIED